MRESNRKPIKRGVVVFLVCICVGLCCLTFFFPFAERKARKIYSLCSSTSISGQYTVEILVYGAPESFSPQSIGIQIGEFGDKIYTTVANDGAELKKENFEFQWDNNVVSVIISGKNQHPVTYQITFGENHCYSVQKQVSP